MVARLITLCLLLGITASPVWACGVLDHADPKVGSSVSTPVTNIRIAFSEAFVPAQSHIELTNAAGEALETRTLSASKGDTVMVLPLATLLSAGHYKVHWQVLWKDCGSATEGHYGFTIAP